MMQAQELDTGIQEEIEQFGLYLEKEKRASKSTVLSYRRDLRKLFLFLDNKGIQNSKDVTATALNSYILQMEREGFSAASVSRSVASMRGFFQYLYKKQMHPVDPSEQLKSPHIEKKAPEILTVEEAIRLLEQPDTSTDKGVRDKAMLELLYATGVRVSELLHLTMSDLQLNMGYIICRDESHERMIPFGNEAAKALITYLDGSRERLLHGAESEILFTNCSGQPMSRQGFWKLIKSYVAKAGIDRDITPHTLRHSFGVHLVQNGADLSAVQEMMGHADRSTTQMYLDMSAKRVREVYERTHPRH
ncbi:MAG: site-specific tyrosine recombinase [Eubacteriales bacterium]|nr:site-specific tyrosine recombinase [Eubacteriales bacterium]